MKFIPILTVSILSLGTTTAQTPDSTVMNVTVGGGAEVPTTTIIPVAQPPIREVDTVYIHTTPPANGCKHCTEKGYDHHRDSLRCHNSKRSPSNRERSDRLNN